MPQYPTKGQEKLIANFYEKIINELSSISNNPDMYTGNNGEFVPNEKFLEIENNKDVQNLISLLKHTQDDFSNTFDGLKDNSHDIRTLLENDDLQNKYERLREYFVLPDYENFIEDLTKE